MYNSNSTFAHSRPAFKRLRGAVPGTENTYSDSNSSDSAETSDNSTSTTSESSTSSESKSDFDYFPLENITMPDGSVVSKYEGEPAGYDYLNFDFSFIRYAQPIYYSSFNDPDLVDWETGKFKIDPNAPIENKTYFRVKTGDKLQNGLIVKSAKYEIYKNGSVSISSIEFDGELTLTGILFCYPEAGLTNIELGDLVFFPDPKEFESLPIAITADYNEVTQPWVDEKNKLAWISDKVDFRLGNINNVSVDLSEIIHLGEYAKVKITLKDIKKGWSDNGSVSRATIVSVEPI